MRLFVVILLIVIAVLAPPALAASQAKLDAWYDVRTTVSGQEPPSTTCDAGALDVSTVSSMTDATYVTLVLEMRGRIVEPEGRFGTCNVWITPPGQGPISPYTIQTTLDRVTQGAIFGRIGVEDVLYIWRIQEPGSERLCAFVFFHDSASSPCLWTVTTTSTGLSAHVPLAGIVPLAGGGNRMYDMTHNSGLYGAAYGTTYRGQFFLHDETS